MDAYLAIASRRDERRYRAGALASETTRRILDAGRLSGSSRNAQPWSFVVVERDDRVQRLAEAVYAPGNVRSAALVVGVLVAGKGPVSFDAGRATQSMLLAAWNEGVASCPNGVRDAELAREALDASPEESVAIVLTFGLPERVRDIAARTAEEWSERANRRPLVEVVRWLR